jgi:hypothetical protein
MGWWGEEVAGDLLRYELVVGEVLVEGVDDPIAVAVGFGAVFGAAGASGVVRVGVADEV